MAEEQELTPEEKLLKVIQRGDAQNSGGGEETQDQLIGSQQDAKILPKASQWHGSMSLFNPLLVLVSIIAIAFSAYEIYKNIPQPEPVYSPRVLDLSSGAAKPVAIASMSDVIDMFATRRIFGKPPEPIKGDVGVADPSKLLGWRAYARDNLEFKGFSRVERTAPDGSTQKVLEAIVIDTKTKKMHLLSVGMKIHIEQKDAEASKKTDLDRGVDVRVDKIIDKPNQKKIVLVLGKESIEIGVPKNKVILH